MSTIERGLVFTVGIGENPAMSSAAKVLIHPSQFPDRVRRDLLDSLRTRKVNHKFHYDSIKQTHKWLALHQAHSPSRNDHGVLEIYDRSFECISQAIKSSRVHLIGLGCGGGQKDARLLRFLAAETKDLFYTPSDVSTAMVLVARDSALAVVAEGNCFPFVCDLVSADDLPGALDAGAPAAANRLVTFFGMIPNFEPELILPKLVALLRREGQLLFSANLAPGPDYAAGLRQILPQYDNLQTREWLMTFLLDLGIEQNDGEMIFRVADAAELKRVEVTFQFHRDREVKVESESFQFVAGEAIRLFFSYRYTPALVRKTLARFGLKVDQEWIAVSEEEGVFLVSKS